MPLAKSITEKMPNLRLAGLMTIGAPDYSGCRVEDFRLMHECRARLVAEKVVSTKNELALSMGMSADFETAIREGSTSVRIGSTIFGAREKKG